MKRKVVHTRLGCSYSNSYQVVLLFRLRLPGEWVANKSAKTLNAFGADTHCGRKASRICSKINLMDPT